MFNHSKKLLGRLFFTANVNSNFKMGHPVERIKFMFMLKSFLHPLFFSCFQIALETFAILRNDLGIKGQLWPIL